MERESGRIGCQVQILEKLIFLNLNAIIFISYMTRGVGGEFVIVSVHRTSAIQYGIWMHGVPVSYTHLDVYKRQNMMFQAVAYTPSS